jgi:hypothetical protein
MKINQHQSIPFVLLPLSSLFFFAALCAGAEGGATPNSKAADWLESQLAAQDKVLWVYRDFADGLNHFTQKAWIGDNGNNVPSMDEASEVAHSGVSGIAAEVDLSKHSWGGYMFLNGALKAGEDVPQNDFSEDAARLDLTGAQKLVFYARGETGREHVDFFMGGLGWRARHAPFPDKADSAKMAILCERLTTEWQRFEFPLEGDSKPDLSRIGSGFAWVAKRAFNDEMSKVRFYIDDIRFEFAQPRLRPLFLQSYASAPPRSEEGVINNFAHLYDNAIAAMALSYAGKHERARQIADAIIYAGAHDRAFSDGRLRNAYSSGNPASFPGWRSKKGAEFARMPGFWSWKDSAWYEDYYAVSTSAGNLAWAILALCEVGRHAPEPEKYVKAARGMGDFVLTLKDTAGGFTAGYEGWEGRQTKATYKSTEHNSDLIAASARLAELTGERKYAEASQHAKAFVLSMYDAKTGAFYTGTKPDGNTINKDVLPLDANTWAILALKDECPDIGKTLAFIEASMAVGGGYDFNEDKDGVWFEGTAQVALAYKQAGNMEKYRKILAFLNQHAAPEGSITAADRDGVTTGFMVSGTDIPWKYGKRTHVGATAWLAFAQMGKNPL